MSKNNWSFYPRIEGARKKPDRSRDGEKNYGKPCIVCGKSTLGQKYVQVDYMRGNDDCVRVCHEHWKNNEEILSAYK